MKKFVPVFCAGALLLSLAACGPKQSADSSGSKQPESSSSASDPAGSSSQQTDTSQAQPQGVEYTLYIGRDGTFQEYPMTYDGELTELGLVPPEAMIAAMAELTGWNLDLVGEVSSGKGGMTVVFADTCSIFTGPPEEQKDEFHVYDTADLAATILDSIQRTLQYNFVDVDSGGDPDSLDVYYCTADDQSILIPGLELTIPMDEPYHGLDLI